MSNVITFESSTVADTSGTAETGGTSWTSSSNIGGFNVKGGSLMNGVNSLGQLTPIPATSLDTITFGVDVDTVSLNILITNPFTGFITMLDDSNVTQESLDATTLGITPGVSTPIAFTSTTIGRKIQFNLGNASEDSISFYIDNVTFNLASAGGGGDPYITTLKGDYYALHKH